jgi:hypothetical protein
MPHGTGQKVIASLVTGGVLLEKMFRLQKGQGEGVAILLPGLAGAGFLPGESAGGSLGKLVISFGGY